MAWGEGGWPVQAGLYSGLKGLAGIAQRQNMASSAEGEVEMEAQEQMETR